MDAKLLFEVVPPGKFTTEKYQEKTIEKIGNAIEEIHPDYINIPEIIEENHIGQAHYRNIDVSSFGKRIYDTTGKKSIINKVVVHTEGIDKFRQWISDSIKSNEVHGFVFVGGNSKVIQYPGPSVIEANKEAKKIQNSNIGNIIIPSRTNEAERAFQKTLCGADFFTTQILFESEKIKKTLIEYEKICTKTNVKPAVFFLSFSPMSTKEEVEFLKWLGVDITKDREKQLLLNHTANSSIQIAQEIWYDLKDFSKEIGLKIKIRPNIEEIMLHNLDHCVELAKRLK